MAKKLPALMRHRASKGFTQIERHDKQDEMFSIGRLSLALSASLALSSCGLINTALRLAPYLLLAEDDGKSSPQQRGRLIENRGDFHPPANLHQAPGQPMAAR
jgi:hypothetical protein